MNLELLYAKIQQPELLGKEDILPLQELCKKHPYSQLFDILYLKALANNKDLHFEDELNKHAFKITDRAKLYDLIHTNPSEVENTIEVAIPEVEAIQEIEVSHEIQEEIEIDKTILPEEIEPETLEEPIALEDSEIIETVEEQIEENLLNEIGSEPEQSYENLLVVEETEKIEAAITNLEVTKEDITNTQVETPTAEIVESVVPELEQEMLAHIVANTYSLELEIQEEQLKEKENQINKLETRVEIEPETKESPIDTTQKRSFSSWLKVSSSSINNDTKANESKQEKPSSISTEKNRTTETELIDKFISDEPEKIKPKAEFFSPVKKAKESLNEENLIYSETLANIYAMQGNYPKAILAFNQLILTNPEKKLYFAQKIEELNQKLNA